MNEQMIAETEDKYKEITNILIRRKLQISTMESCTCGLIASLLTDTEGASAVYRGGFVTYSNEAKILQGVPEETISSSGVYSRETACAMAEQCRKAYHADLGIGVTGSFGNVDPNNADSVIGEVYFAISHDEQTDSFFLTLPEQSCRLAYKLKTASAIADELRNILKG